MPLPPAEGGALDCQGPLIPWSLPIHLHRLPERRVSSLTHARRGARETESVTVSPGLSRHGEYVKFSQPAICEPPPLECVGK